MGVTYLLDTHVLLWLIGDPGQLDEEQRGHLADRRNVLLVSAVSALEVATKVRLGELVAPGLVDAWSRRIADIGAEELPITGTHALLAGSMSWQHRDPFDRLLVAQGIVESATLVTRDSAMRQLPAPRLWMV